MTMVLLLALQAAECYKYKWIIINQTKKYKKSKNNGIVNNLLKISKKKFKGWLTWERIFYENDDCLSKEMLWQGTSLSIERKATHQLVKRV